jgi:hypothetical protein
MAAALLVINEKQAACALLAMSPAAVRTSVADPARQDAGRVYATLEGHLASKE